jgi:hypothetical protein
MPHISVDISLFVLASILYGLLFWIAILFWVTKDALYRSTNISFHIVAILINLVIPFVGLFIYLLIRPEKSMLEVFHEELERRVFGERQFGCSECGGLNSEDAKFCIFCGEKLFTPCQKCEKENIRKAKFCSGCGSTMNK